MRTFFILCIGLAVAYWADRTYYKGAYSRPFTSMIHEIAVSYK
jgi:hypothetical protein